MFIKKTIKQEDGTYVIEGEFNSAEVDVILEAGLNTLLEHGALPFMASEGDDNLYLVSPPSTVEQ